MYHVEVTNIEDYIFKAKANNAEFTIDAKGGGISPLDALLASLGSCIGVYMKKYAEGTKIPIKNFKVTLDAEFTKERPIRFQDINAKINIEGLKLEATQLNGLLAFIKYSPDTIGEVFYYERNYCALIPSDKSERFSRAVIKNCPAHNTLKNNPNIDIKIA